mgnify:FL=1
MVSIKTVRNIARQFVTWSAVFMLLVQPLGALGADCGCSSANETSNVSWCSGTDTCCGSAETSCCSKTLSCCSTTTTSDDAPCSCGDSCQCSAADDNQSSNPVIPVNDSTCQQTHILALANQTISGIDGTVLGREFSRVETASPFSLTAQQVCVLLSRFTC